MKKSLISLTLLASLMFGAEYSPAGMDLLLKDVDTLNTYAMEHIDEIDSSEAKLNAYEAKFNELAQNVAQFSQQKMNSFTSKEDALHAMDKLEELSSKSVVVAKEVAYLSSHQADNANESYNNTLKTLTQTTLRLSDDIGDMADRILEMADKIGVMADRIIKTQEIQSRNLNATTQLASVSAQNLNMQLPHQNQQQSPSAQTIGMQTAHQNQAVQTPTQTVHLQTAQPTQQLQPAQSAQPVATTKMQSAAPSQRAVPVTPSVQTMR